MNEPHVTYYINGLFRQVNAELAREYLGITPGGGSGTVTNALNLINNAVALGDGGTVGIKTLVSLGSLGQVLTSNGAGFPPSFQPSASAGITELTGDVVAGPGTGSQPATIPNDTVSYAQMQNVSAISKLLGRGSAAGAGDVEEITLGTNLTMNGTTLDASGGATPGGADKNVQYNNAGAFGGVGNNATASNKFLRQVSSGTPSMEFVTDADISTSDITTNDVSIAKHGFAPKAPNDVEQYLDGTGNYSVPYGTGDNAWGRTKEASISSIGSTAAVAFQNHSCQLGQQNANATSSTATANQLDCYNVATSATTVATNAFIGTIAAGSTGGDWIYGRKTRWVAFVTPVDNTNARYWFGVANISGNTMAASDTPAGNYAAFRYSSTAGDTNWQAVVGDNATNEVIDTGVLVSNTVMARLEIVWDGTAANSFDFLIDSVLVATGTLNPAAATLLHFFCQVTIVTAGGTAKNFRLSEQKLRVSY